MTSADPVVGLSARHERPVAGRMHSHPRAQLICAVSSPAAVRLRSRQWTVGPGEAAWLPVGVEHSVSSARAPHFQSIYVRSDLASGLEVPEGLLPVSTFLGELMSRLAGLYRGHGDAGTYPHLVQLLLSELGSVARPRSELPMPANRHLQSICQTLIETPGDRRTLDEWAALTGTSRRLLERLFQGETGMSFSQWRQMCRVKAAIPLLRAGRPIQQVAWELGYESPSAFGAMFRRVAGVAPTALRGPE